MADYHLLAIWRIEAPLEHERSAGSGLPLYVGRLSTTVGAGLHTHSGMTALPAPLDCRDAVSMAPHKRRSAVYRRRPRQRSLPLPLQIIRPLAS